MINKRLQFICYRETNAVTLSKKHDDLPAVIIPLFTNTKAASWVDDDCNKAVPVN